PRAVVLAAVRTRILTVEQILGRLDDRFALLTGGDRVALPRHQTLRGAIDWSYDLLTTADQTVLRRLGSFAGRFTLEDVGGVCAFDDVPASEVLDIVSSLLDKSLVIKDEVGGIACYRLHETMREYGALKTHEVCEEDLLADRYIDYYRTTCLSAAPGARSVLRTGLPGPSWSSTTFARCCRPACSATTLPADWISRPRCATTGLPTAPRRAFAGWTNCWI